MYGSIGSCHAIWHFRCGMVMACMVQRVQGKVGFWNCVCRVSGWLGGMGMGAHAMSLHSTGPSPVPRPPSRPLVELVADPSLRRLPGRDLLLTLNPSAHAVAVRSALTIPSPPPNPPNHSKTQQPSIVLSPFSSQQPQPQPNPLFLFLFPFSCTCTCTSHKTTPHPSCSSLSAPSSSPARPSPRPSPSTPP